jgi:hypothetical protein
MFDWSLAGDWLGGSGLHDAQYGTLGVQDHDSYMLSQTVPRHLYPLAALERPQGLASRDSLRLESADSYTHHGIMSIRKVLMSSGTYEENSRQSHSCSHRQDN